MNTWCNRLRKRRSDDCHGCCTNRKMVDVSKDVHREY